MAITIDDLLAEIMESRKGSIGSFDNVYLSQLSVHHVLEAKNDLIALYAENHRLTEKLGEYENYLKAVADEKCTCDQKHCTCVPGLRLRIKELEAELTRIRRMVDWALKPDAQDALQRMFDKADQAGIELENVIKCH